MHATSSEAWLRAFQEVGPYREDNKGFNPK